MFDAIRNIAARVVQGNTNASVSMSVDEFASEVTNRLSVDEFASELPSCLSVDEFASVLTNCLSVDEFASCPIVCPSTISQASFHCLSIDS